MMGRIKLNGLIRQSCSLLTTVYDCLRRVELSLPPRRRPWASRSSHLWCGCACWGNHLQELRWWRRGAWWKGEKGENYRPSDLNRTILTEIQTVIENRWLVNYHWNGDTAAQFTKMYCPLLYLKPWGLDIWRAITFPGYTATCIKDQEKSTAESGITIKLQ